MYATGEQYQKTHITRPLLRYGQKVQVDQGIHELIRRLWKAGIDTTGSCEENLTGHKLYGVPVEAYIDFPSRTDAALFLKQTLGDGAVQKMQEASHDLDREEPSVDLGNGWTARWSYMTQLAQTKHGIVAAPPSRDCVNFVWVEIGFPPSQIAVITAAFQE